MELETFERAEKVVREIRELIKEHEDYQDVMGGFVQSLTIETENGKLQVKDPDRRRKIDGMIDQFYFDEEQRLKKVLEEIK